MTSQLLINSEVLWICDTGKPRNLSKCTKQGVRPMTFRWLHWSNETLTITMPVILFPHFTRLIYGFVAAVIIVNDEEFSIKPGTDCKTCSEHTIKKLLFLSAFVAYLGFLNVLVAHSHPVMLVFCHLLINRNSDSGLKESFPQTVSSGASREENYREGRSCFCHCFSSFCRLSNGHRSKKSWNKKG